MIPRPYKNLAIPNGGRPLIGLHKSTRGIVLLALLTVLVVALTMVLVSRLSVDQLRAIRTQDNAHILGIASEGLLGYALAQVPPGTLPCPDTTGDGLENQSAGGCQSQRGLLPYRTLNITKPTDRTGAVIWYAVELTYVNNSPGDRNTSRTTSLILNGDLMAAVLIAPGKAINNQNRVPLNASDFLEGENSNALLNAYASPSDTTGNDQLLGIGTASFWSLIARRVLGVSTQLLADYRAVCNEYPWAAPFGGPYISAANLQSGSLPLTSALPVDWGAACPGGNAPTPDAWLISHWQDELYYRMCTAADGSCITTVGNANPPASAILLSPGVVLTGQSRPSSNVGNFFELENVLAPATQFRDLDTLDHSTTYNDVTSLLIP